MDLMMLTITSLTKDKDLLQRKLDQTALEVICRKFTCETLNLPPSD
jgi:hypothetical protein